MRAADKQTYAHIEQMQDNIRDAAREIETLHGEICEQIANLLAPLIEATESYNEAVAEYNEILEEVIADVESYYEEKSEKWQEGEKGQEYQAWIDAMREHVIEIADVPEVPEIDVPNVVQPEGTPPLSLSDM